MKYIILALTFFFLYQSGQAQDNNIDAAFVVDKTTICFIKGDKVVHYDILEKKVKATKSLQSTFPKLPFDKVDAIWDKLDGNIYIFNGNQVISFDKKANQLNMTSLQAIGEGGLGLPIGKVAAAMVWPNGKSFLFSGNKFIQYDNATAQTDERFPKRIVEPLWPGMKFNHIDAAFSFEGKTYFFSNYQFVVFDIDNKHTDSNPQKICGWPGLCDALDLAPYEGIDFFQGTWREALMKAKAENKYVFLDAYTSWCKPCKWMAAEIFPLATVGKVYNEKFICLKMNMEQGEGPNLRKVYNINTYPTLLFVAPTGKILSRTASSLGEEKFIELGESVE